MAGQPSDFSPEGEHRDAFSLEGEYPNFPGLGCALASGNLYGTVLEQGSRFGLQFSNPVDTGVAYGGSNHAGGNANKYGQPNDPLVGEFIGGVNVFGGGLTLYDLERNSPWWAGGKR